MVKELILKRTEYDRSFLPELYQDNVLSTEGVFPLEDDVLCTYIDLDVLIEACGLSQMEQKIVDWLMQGYGLTDIAEVLGYVRQTADTMFDRAVEKIVSENNRRWLSCYSDKPISQMRW